MMQPDTEALVECRLRVKSLLFTIINHEIPWESHFSSPLITINHYWIQQWLSPIFKQTRKAKRPLQLTLLQTWPTLGPKKLPGLYGYWWYINGMGLDMGCITSNMIYIYIYDDIYYIWLYIIIYDYVWLYIIIYDYVWLYMIIYDYIWLYIYDYIWLNYIYIYDYI